jgi:hypothetical protein
MLSTHSIAPIENVPVRQFVRMKAQPLVPWTPGRLIQAVLQRMVAEVAEVPETESIQPAESTSL